MSVVSGITLQISCAEDYVEQNEGPDDVPLVNQINEWLSARQDFWHLTSVEEHFCCGKHPQVLVYGGGFNYFPEEEFAAFVMSLPWRYPENVVLLVNPEDGPTRVIRPTDEPKTIEGTLVAGRIAAGLLAITKT